MSLDYYVLCRDRPAGVEDGWRYDDIDIAHVWVASRTATVERLEAEYAIDAALVIGMNCHHSAAEYVEELGKRLARAYRGIVWCDHVDGRLYDESKRPRGPVELASLERVAANWGTWVKPRVAERRAAAEAQKARRDELFEKAQSGEDVGGWDWGLDE
jgi:hypothetical protein